MSARLTTTPKGGLLIYVLILSLLLTACSGLQGGSQLPESPLLRVLERKKGLTAYAGVDGNIYTIDQGGSNQEAVTTDANLNSEGGYFRFYQQFSWSPDSQKLAFVGLHATRDSQKATIFTAEPNGNGIVETFSSGGELPIYLYWTPDSQNVSFLTSSFERPDLFLLVAPANGFGESEIISRGAPYYWAWEPDSSRVLAHGGGSQDINPDARISMFTPGSEFERELGLAPTFFRAPSWSPDGNELMMAVRTVNGESSLVVTNLQGQIRQTLASFENSAAFNWSPDGRWIAYIVSERRVQGVLGPLTIVDPNLMEEKIVSEEDTVFAYFWSPDRKNRLLRAHSGIG